MIMKRTTIMLPEELRLRASKRAARIGVSLGELIRQSLADTLRQAKRRREEDPLFADRRVFTGDAPSDASVNHDKYIYDEL
jgi:hypothetical protein